MKFLTLLILILFSGNILAQEISVSELSCEYLNKPLGIDVTEPGFSWKIMADKDVRDVYQEYYHIQVSNSENEFNNTNNLVWDSKQIRSNQSIHVKYKGQS
ncbi:MAG: hypothetical protein JEZ01_06135 [Labilibaculum sp.]|nr:hypothetical protein [Labilibaculum sp.]MBI9057333.1 hypothetical protein [Labilibaculum sp.]